ncbi:MAG: PEP-CTERM sorting domain-containing protein, partial [Verrucomicrobiae bacterium]|nr:PEP-CTERM sorting domain-containing protein [Verrucomicrobiae bacterium]
KEDTYDSYIFSEANPNLIGTVGTGVLQDMLMEPSADFTATVRRLELTNVDVAALQDLGWSVVPEPSTSFLLGAGALCLGLRRRRLRQ